MTTAELNALYFSQVAAHYDLIHDRTRHLQALARRARQRRHYFVLGDAT